MLVLFYDSELMNSNMDCGGSPPEFIFCHVFLPIHLRTTSASVFSTPKLTESPCLSEA